MLVAAFAGRLLAIVCFVYWHARVSVMQWLFAFCCGFSLWPVLIVVGVSICFVYNLLCCMYRLCVMEGIPLRRVWVVTHLHQLCPHIQRQNSMNILVAVLICCRIEFRFCFMSNYIVALLCVRTEPFDNQCGDLAWKSQLLENVVKCPSSLCLGAGLMKTFFSLIFWFVISAHLHPALSLHEDFHQTALGDIAMLHRV